MFVGQATAIGFKIIIPNLIQSLANTELLSFDNSFGLLEASDHVELNEINSPSLLETFEYSWWDNSNVTVWISPIVLVVNTGLL
jgi:hypothetical protein